MKYNQPENENWIFSFWLFFVSSSSLFLTDAERLFRWRFVRRFSFDGFFSFLLGVVGQHVFGACRRFRIRQQVVFRALAFPNEGAIQKGRRAGDQPNRDDDERRDDRWTFPNLG